MIEFSHKNTSFLLTEECSNSHWLDVNKDTLADVSHRYKYALFDYKYYQLIE